MVVKPNGKTEHNDDAHDDLVFSYLWALYVFYYGEDLVNRFHLLKTEIQTDDNYNETSYELEEDLEDEIKLDSMQFGGAYDTEFAQSVNEQLGYLSSGNTLSMEDLNQQILDSDKEFINRLLMTDFGREVYAKHNHLDKGELDKVSNSFETNIVGDLNKILYNEESNKVTSNGTNVVGNLADMFAMIGDD